MKRYISMFLLIIVCFLLQTSVFPHLKLTNVMPNLLVVITSAAGFMYGRKFGLFTGFLCGALIDLLYSSVAGVSIFIYVLIGYGNGMTNKLYFKDDFTIPLFALAVSDLAYGFLYYICYFLMRGRLEILSYLIQIMIPEMIYTIVLGILIYKFMHWLEEKMYPEQEVPLGKGEKTD
ncbi:MAG TPA: rod shape-determining protein MreD [Lachnospiraceae bacterium]|nr:rod shape-determining protein MreD [Lachnospiraceae bacterium]